MKSVLICAFALLVAPTLLASGANPGQPPIEFTLSQNIPNPFCADPAVPGSGPTEIRFALPQQAEVLLTVWSPDTTAVVKTLVYAALSAGFHTVFWDGRDGGGQLVTDGVYPYSLVANAVGGGSVLFADTLAATVACSPVGNQSETWGAVKSLYAD